MASPKKTVPNTRARGGFKSSRHAPTKAPAAGNTKASAAGNKSEQKRAAEERENKGKKHPSHETSKFLQGGRIMPRRIDGTESAADLIDGTFLAYNGVSAKRASSSRRRCWRRTSPSA